VSSGDRLLLFYPRGWRERYGPELLALVEAASDGGRIPVRIRLNVIRAGLVQRLRSSGLVGDEVPPAARARAGLLLVLCSWSAFAVAGIGLQKASEHWRSATPRSDQAVPTAAFDSVVVAAAIASALVLLGIAFVVRPLGGFLRDGGWRHIRRSVLRATSISGLTAVLLVALAAWAHGLTSAQRNGGDWLYAGGFLLAAAFAVCSVAAWTQAAVTTARHLNLERVTLQVETVAAGAVSLAMAVITGATVIWWASVASAAPTFLGAQSPWYTGALTLTMLGATSLGIAGALRAVHDTRLVGHS
jgi:hypothetical protein